MAFQKSLLTAPILASTLGLMACDGDDGDDGSAGSPGTSQTLIELNTLGTYASGAFVSTPV